MISLIQGIANFFSSVGSFIVSFISGLINLFKYIAMALVTVGEVVLYLPADLQILCMAFISVAVVYLIVGR